MSQTDPLILPHSLTSKCPSVFPISVNVNCIPPINSSFRSKTWYYPQLIPSSISMSNPKQIMLVLPEKHIQNLTTFHHPDIYPSDPNHYLLTGYYNNLLTYLPNSVLISFQSIIKTAARMILIKH